MSANELGKLKVITVEMEVERTVEIDGDDGKVIQVFGFVGDYRVCLYLKPDEYQPREV